MIPDDVWRAAQIHIARLLAECRRRGMVPVLVIAQDPAESSPIHLGIYPVGSAMDQTEVAKFLGQLVKQLKSGVVTEVGYGDHPPKPLPKGGAHEFN